ncbi:hypothetical protein [Brevibacterium album]|uniref:hypothetical protein n=1 Tax=Brevibacterium album TaxID=417948 RepID=UPI00040804AC|nr:hypothetical protein [Brevibacterium album]
MNGTNIRRNGRRALWAALISGTAAIALSACGGGTAYEFQVEGVEPDTKLRIALPEDLREAVGEGVSDRLLVEGYRAQARELAGVEYCALELRIDYADDALEVLSAPLDGNSSAESLGERLGFSSVVAGAAFDPDAPEHGTYISEDMVTAIVVDRCATSASDPDEGVEVVFPILDEESSDGTDEFAEANVSVMADGTLGVMGAVDGYTLDANGNWIAY